MLERLYIQNLLTIEKQVVEFSPGFSVITGETGAGKSVLIKALGLVFGNKVSKELIRPGADQLVVEAVFSDYGSLTLKDVLTDWGIDTEEELIIRRTVQATGKSKILINQLTSTQGQLAEIGSLMIDIHGQFAQQSLLKSSRHLEYLDKYSECRDLTDSFKNKYDHLRNLEAKQRDWETSEEERLRRIDFLRFQVKEIEQADLNPGEEENLHVQHAQLSNRENLVQLLSGIAAWNEEENTPVSQVSSALNLLQQANGIDAKLEEQRDILQSGLISLEECSREIRTYLEGLESDPAKLDFLNERLALIEELKRKYGSTVDEVLNYLQEIKSELSTLEQQEGSKDEVEKEITSLHKELVGLAEKISEIRVEKSRELESTIIAELKDLELAKSRFEVQIKTKETGSRTPSSSDFFNNGWDSVEFFIATNPGSPLRPLSKAISGGELSRVMLALKTSLQRVYDPSILVFDEIDTGISGRIAEKVGKKMRELTGERQVIAITHLPQIASLAEQHYKVQKKVVSGATSTRISLLDNRDRQEELASLLAGEEITETTRNVAKEMLEAQD